MVERIGCHNARWQRIKRSDFLRSLDGNHLDKEIFAGRPPESSLSSDSSMESTKASSAKKHSSSTTDPSSSLRPNETPLATTESSDKISSSSESIEGIGQSIASEQSMAKQTSVSSIPAVAAAKDNIITPSSSNSEPPAKRQKKGDEVDFQSNNIVAALAPAPSKASHSAPIIPMQQALCSAQLKMVNSEQIGALYAINEDDMIMIEDVMMCPFVYRTKNAVLCGALQDCVIPGMLRAQFSNTNKLLSVELVFDSMGFMQQLDAGNGSDITAQVIPGSLEMAIMPCTHEARVITEAKAPHSILHVNEAWARMTQYSQVECEGRQLHQILAGENTDPNAGIRPGKPIHRFEDVARGRPACSTNIHYRKSGKPFVNFMCSYPLTK